MMRKAFKYRLYPTKKQAELLDRTLWLCREVYNAALQERRDAYRKSGVSVGYYEQKRSLVEAKRLVPELKGVHSQVLQDVTRRVDLAFQAFFRRVKGGEKPGYPRFRGRYRYDSFTYPQAGEAGAKPLEEAAKAYLPKVGNVRCKYHRPLEGIVKTATVRREGEHWYITFSCVVEPQPLPVTGRVMAFDLGANPNFLIPHEGEPVQAPRHWKRSARKIARLQKARSRKKRGSRRRKELRRQVRREHQRAANRRRDFHHKLARQIVNEHDDIIHENLRPKNMARGYAAASIHNAGWGQFIDILSFKAAEAGRRVVPVDPAFTSQDCTGYGHRQKVPIGRPYECEACSATLDRDVNAARNILARGLDGAIGETMLVAAGQ